MRGGGRFRGGRQVEGRNRKSEERRMSDERNRPEKVGRVSRRRTDLDDLRILAELWGGKEGADGMVIRALDRRQRASERASEGWQR